MFKTLLAKSVKFSSSQKPSALVGTTIQQRVFKNSSSSSEQINQSSSLIIRHNSINYKYASRDGLCKLPPIKSDREMTLVLDLDECLIASSEAPFQNSFPCYPECHVVLRPGLEEFLVEMEKRYEIVLLTAGVKYHADNVLKHMPDVFTHRLYRHHIFQTKRVDSLQRDMDKTIFLDNEISYLRDNISNMLLMRPYYGNPIDTELKDVTEILSQIAEEKSVAAVSIDGWNYERCMEYVNRAR